MSDKKKLFFRRTCAVTYVIDTSIQLQHFFFARIFFFGEFLKYVFWPRRPRKTTKETNVRPLCNMLYCVMSYIRFLLAFLIVLERMPGKRESNWRGGRREKAAIKMRASRSRCAEGNVLAVAEKLAWSGSLAKENVDFLASEGFDKRLLEKIKDESATCACAFCGMIIFGDAKMRHARDVAEVFSSTARWPRFSARGVATSNFVASFPELCKRSQKRRGQHSAIA
jgi:hypothetical protein